MNNSCIIFIGNYEIDCGFECPMVSVMYWEETSIYTGVIRINDECIISCSHSILESLLADVTKSVIAIKNGTSDVKATFN
jgi:hypothetical protein